MPRNFVGALMNHEFDTIPILNSEFVYCVKCRLTRETCEDISCRVRTNVDHRLLEGALSSVLEDLRDLCLVPPDFDVSVDILRIAWNLAEIMAQIPDESKT